MASHFKAITLGIIRASTYTFWENTFISVEVNNYPPPPNKGVSLLEGLFQSTLSSINKEAENQLFPSLSCRLLWLH